MSSVVQIVNLGSGSSGNATVIWNRHGGVLIDNGFSKKELLARMDAAGVPRQAVTAVILTHEHGDHIKGVRLACDAFRAPLYISAMTYRWCKANQSDLPAETEIKRFMPGYPIRHAEMLIEPFLIMHDASEPVGLVIRCGNLKIGVATDMGKFNQLAVERLRDCHYLMLESNYDFEMLMNSARPLSLKRRIMGTHGHLDNRLACEMMSELLTERSRYLTLAHLSSHCNHAEIVQNLFSERLAEMKRDDIVLSIANQKIPMQPIQLTVSEHD